MSTYPAHVGPDARQAGDPSGRAFPTRTAALAFLGLVVFLLAGHWIVLRHQPTPRLWGDEPEYAALVKGLAERGENGVLPGSLPFEHRPLFGVQLLSSLRGVTGEASPFRTASALNLVLLPVLLWLVYLQGRALRLSWPAALTGVALLGLSPWFAFHVHSLWPEVLHATLFAVTLFGLFRHLNGGALWPLVVAGSSTAFALFTKGVLGPFLPLFAVLLFWNAVRLAPLHPVNRSPAGWLARCSRLLAAPAVYLGTTFLVLLPQLVHNESMGHGWRLSANRWWNLELGLTSDPPARTVADVNRLYLSSAASPEQREELARQRTLTFLSERGTWSVVRHQLTRFGELFVERLSAFEMSLVRMERWGPEPPGWIAALRVPGRVHWYALLLLALAGMLTRWRTSAPWFLLFAFTGCFLVALLAVPLKVRFALPLVPVLALFAAGAIERLAQRLGWRAWGRG